MSERRSHADMAHELAKLVYSKVEWLHRFSAGKNRRGDHEIELKRRELEVLQQAKDDYQRVAEKAA